MNITTSVVKKKNWFKAQVYEQTLLVLDIIRPWICHFSNSLRDDLSSLHLIYYFLLYLRFKGHQITLKSRALPGWKKWQIKSIFDVILIYKPWNGNDTVCSRLGKDKNATKTNSMNLKSYFMERCDFNESVQWKSLKYSAGLGVSLLYFFSSIQIVPYKVTYLNPGVLF